MLSFGGLLILSPIMLSLSALIKFCEPDEPVFFTQKRVGRYGRLFSIYKFRTMYSRQTNKSPVSVLGEERITPVGAFLRKYKLDELPELWNILKGNMSFVGPRPDVPGYADSLQGENRKILELLPGLTGPATLKYRNEEELLAMQENPKKYNDEILFPDKVRINLYYYHHPSMWNDLKIMYCTIFKRKMFYAGEMIG